MIRLEGCVYKCEGCLQYSATLMACLEVIRTKVVKPVPSGKFTKEELFELHKSTTENCLTVMKAKNHDYTADGGPFANFMSSKTRGIHPVMGILLRADDKFMRIQTFLSKGTLAVEGEGVLDAFDDVINYMILAKGIILEEQRVGK